MQFTQVKLVCLNSGLGKYHPKGSVGTPYTPLPMGQKFKAWYHTRVLTQIQPGFTASVNAPNPDCNPGWLNPHPLVDWNSVRDRKRVESGLELSCKQGLRLLGICASASLGGQNAQDPMSFILELDTQAYGLRLVGLDIASSPGSLWVGGGEPGTHWSQICPLFHVVSCHNVSQCVIMIFWLFT